MKKTRFKSLRFGNLFPHRAELVDLFSEQIQQWWGFLLHSDCPEIKIRDIRLKDHERLLHPGITPNWCSGYSSIFTAVEIHPPILFDRASDGIGFTLRSFQGSPWYELWVIAEVMRMLRHALRESGQIQESQFLGFSDLHSIPKVYPFRKYTQNRIHVLRSVSIGQEILDLETDAVIAAAITASNINHDPDQDMREIFSALHITSDQVRAERCNEAFARRG